MKKLDLNSLKARMLGWFVGFSVVLMIILWLFQIILLQTFYRHMKSNEINKIAANIAHKYNSETIDDTINELSYSRGLAITVFDQDAKIEISTFTRGLGANRTPPEAVKKMIDGANNSKKGSYTTVFGENSRGSVIMCCRKIIDKSGKSHYIIIDTYVEPVDATVRILCTQLIVVTFISLTIALFISFFAAEKLSKPIRKTAKSAAQLAKGNYNVNFGESGYSEINQLSGVLNHTADVLAKTDKMRRDIVANVSHDLRTPLTIIKSYAEMIRDISGDNPKKRNAHAEVIIGESDRLALLVSDLLDLSKIESGTEKYNMSVFDVSQTVETIVRRFRAPAELSGIKLEMKCDKNLFIRADFARIEQVVYNLVSNGINYVGDDNLLYVEANLVGDKARVSVRDNGGGISPDEIDLVWERYYKNSTRHRRLGNGTGIGLSIVKRILDAHGADYGVKSKVGEGSEFWFEFKLIEK